MMNDDTMNDDTTTVTQLRERIRAFVAARQWHEYHAPKNLTMALAIEVSELMEHFQWLTTEESRTICEDAVKREMVCDELADVIGYALAIANELGIDVSTAMREKMVKNEAKYPAEQYRGRYE